MLILRDILSRLALKIVVMARQKAKGKRQEVLGDFTFLYIPLIFYVHLLNSDKINVLKFQKISFI